MTFDVLAVLEILIGTSDDAPSWVEVVPWAAFVAGVIALAVAGWNQLEARRDRRRTLYSEAYRAALEWIELYYRVRRRDPENPHELVGLFHAAQESINYHEGWISTESPVLGRAYNAFVEKVKSAARPLIQEAWSEPPCNPEDGLELPDHQHPNVDEAKRQFLTDVSDHLSLDHGRRANLNARYPPPPTKES
ncbi:MAG: hypothetical protein QOI10_3468 [Solirubrobacterales bacterium]|jgi:hypothetical protein|nr:hypothetical protein [Solirubrobacterales bacterium]